MNETGVVLAVSAEARGDRRGRGRGRSFHWRWGGRTALTEHEELARLVKQRGGYDLVAVGYEYGGEPSIADAMEGLMERGATRVVVVPTGMRNSDLAQVIASLRARYPDVQIVCAEQPADRTRPADWIVDTVRQLDAACSRAEAGFGFARLAAIRTGERAVIHDFDAGHTLVGRLAALGFTPGTEVTMLQNYGNGPVIVRVRDTRIALGRGEATKIRVRRMDREE
jgi:ferrous iron transport protein A